MYSSKVIQRTAGNTTDEGMDSGNDELNTWAVNRDNVLPLPTCPLADYIVLYAQIMYEYPKVVHISLSKSPPSVSAFSLASSSSPSFSPRQPLDDLTLVHSLLVFSIFSGNSIS